MDWQIDGIDVRMYTFFISGCTWQWSRADVARAMGLRDREKWQIWFLWDWNWWFIRMIYGSWLNLVTLTLYAGEGWRWKVEALLLRFSIPIWSNQMNFLWCFDFWNDDTMAFFPKIPFANAQCVSASNRCEKHSCPFDCVFNFNLFVTTLCLFVSHYHYYCIIHAHREVCAVNYGPIQTEMKIKPEPKQFSNSHYVHWALAITR